MIFTWWFIAASAVKGERTKANASQTHEIITKDGVSPSRCDQRVAHAS